MCVVQKTNEHDTRKFKRNTYLRLNIVNDWIKTVKSLIFLKFWQKKRTQKKLTKKINEKENWILLSFDLITEKKKIEKKIEKKEKKKKTKKTKKKIESHCHSIWYRIMNFIVKVYFVKELNSVKSISTNYCLNLQLIDIIKCWTNKWKSLMM